MILDVGPSSWRSSVTSRVDLCWSGQGSICSSEDPRRGSSLTRASGIRSRPAGAQCYNHATPPPDAKKLLCIWQTKARCVSPSLVHPSCFLLSQAGPQSLFAPYRSVNSRNNNNCAADPLIVHPNWRAEPNSHATGTASSLPGT